MGSPFLRAFAPFKRSRSPRRKHPVRVRLSGARQRAFGAERLEARWYLSSDPIVTVATNYGNFQIELLPTAAPQSVTNFLNYVQSGAYTNTIFHRSVPNFIVQTGGFTSASATYTSTSQFATIPTQAPIPLEYNLPNTLGTVAMARTSSPNSATDEWFVNTVDNTNALGQSNGGGYAVFGKIIGNGMQVINAIAAVPTKAADAGAFNTLPVDSNNQLVRISSVTLDSIDGTVFSDVNGNGNLDSGEQGIAGRTVFIDKDGTGSPTANDPQTTTDANGHYSFSGLAPGTYTVREVLPSGVSLTTGTQTVTVTAGQTSSGNNFGEHPSISGTVFVDLNANGALDSGEPGLAGATVFLNVDGTGSPTNNPHATTSSNGSFSFNGQTAGTYTVMVQLTSGVTLSTPTQTATVGSGGAGPSNLVFGEVPSIDGLVFLDANANGVADQGEQAIGGRTVFLNIDGSGAPDANNPSATTNANGVYYFLGVAAGNYNVRDVAPAGTHITSPAQNIIVTAGHVTSAVNFGEVPPSITGTVFVDMNTNGSFDAGDLGLAGRTVFLNNDGTGAPDASNPSTTTDSLGKYYFTGLAPGNYSVREVVAAGVTLTTNSQTVAVTANQTKAGVNFGEAPSITGTVFTDLNGDGTFSANEPGVANRTVFLNIDGTGVPDASNPSASTDANGNFVFSGLAAGSYSVKEVLQSNVTLTTPVQSAAVTSGNTVHNLFFGERPSITGTVFIDENGNAQFDTSEPGVPGQKVFLNVDNSGSPTSNPTAITDSNGVFSFTGLAPGNYTVMAVLPSGVTLTTPVQTVAVAAGQTKSGVLFGDRPSITGSVFSDANGNGILDSGEQGVAGRTVFIDTNNNGLPDTGEPTTVTSPSGNYAFLGLAAGTYSVREVVPSGTVLSTVPVQSVVVTAGQASGNVNFGEATDTTTPNITGTVFEDNNLNAKRDSGERVLAGRTVFIDKDGSGVPGPNNPSTTTNANGSYSFFGLPAGNYTIKEVVSTDHGISITTPVRTATVIVGQTQAGMDFGNLMMSTIAPLPYTVGGASSSSSSSDPNGAFINGVFQSVLGRAADSVSLAYWKGKLANGASHADVARGVWDSTEHRSNEIEQYYHTFLGRGSDAVGKAFWLQTFQNTKTFDTLANEKLITEAFLTSDEYSKRLHATDAAFVTALYQDLTARAPDSAGLAAWEKSLSNGATRLQVITSFLNNPETVNQLIDGFYADFLHRSVDSAGQQKWDQSLQSNSASIEDVAVSIMGANEYFARVTS